MSARERRRPSDGTGWDADGPGHDGDGYTHRPLSALETTPEKPGRRWKLSPALGIDGFNFNVAVLAPAERVEGFAELLNRRYGEERPDGR